jgi:hypothetical protein
MRASIASAKLAKAMTTTRGDLDASSHAHFLRIGAEIRQKA